MRALIFFSPVAWLRPTSFDIAAAVAVSVEKQGGRAQGPPAQHAGRDNEGHAEARDPGAGPEGDGGGGDASGPVPDGVAVPAVRQG